MKTNDLAAYRRNVVAKHLAGADVRHFLECVVESAREAELTLQETIGQLVSVWLRDEKKF